MKKSAAISKFNELFEATYDDALAFVVGKTGNILLADEILTETYSELFAYLKKCNEYSINEIHDFFLNLIKETTKSRTTNEQSLDSAVSVTEEQMIASEKLTELLNTEFNINEKQLQDDLILKKINRYILQKDDIRKKTFVLHYYCGYTLEQISTLLGLSITHIENYIFQILSEIKKSFLNNYVNK